MRPGAEKIILHMRQTLCGRGLWYVQRGHSHTRDAKLTVGWMGTVADTGAADAIVAGPGAVEEEEKEEEKGDGHSGDREEKEEDIAEELRREGSRAGRGPGESLCRVGKWTQRAASGYLCYDVQ